MKLVIRGFSVSRSRVLWKKRFRLAFIVFFVPSAKIGIEDKYSLRQLNSKKPTLEEQNIARVA